MKNYTLYIVLLFSLSMKAQIQDTLKTSSEDSTVIYSIGLKEIDVTKDNAYASEMDAERKKILILKRRVYKVYPYAKLTAEKLLQIDATMEKLKTKKEKKKYFKLVENYLQEEFEPKKLSRKDGQILVKLISRQTGETTFNLIKDYKSGWKAFWSNGTAKLFNINLKTEYQPFEVAEDFYIESILIIAFKQRHLAEQAAANPIDLKKMVDGWREKNEKIIENRKLKDKKNTD
uniref:DUF4294 domain-containing protein n=1 Tax=Flavobacterium sp. TaxID=239 RepID=UPI00404AF68D